MLDNCSQYTRLHIPQYSLNAIAINIDDITLRFNPATINNGSLLVVFIFICIIILHVIS